jgi:hypothetical protein
MRSAITVGRSQRFIGISLYIQAAGGIEPGSIKNA